MFPLVGIAIITLLLILILQNTRRKKKRHPFLQERRNSQWSSFHEQWNAKKTERIHTQWNSLRKRWKWWHWIGLGIVYFGILFAFGSSWKGIEWVWIFTFMALIGIYKQFNKSIRKYRTPSVRFLLEFILFAGLVIISYFVLEGVMTLQRSDKIKELGITGEIYIDKSHMWKDMLIYCVGYAIILTLIINVIRYVTTGREKKRKQKEMKMLRLQEELNQAQLESLRARINPHFLYNALNSIAGLALTDGENTRKMALALSRFFSWCTDKEMSHLIPVRQEVEIIRTYLEIEKIRFGDQLDFQIQVEKEVEDCLMPRLLLQPLAENSVKHAMKEVEAEAGVCIKISIVEEKGRVRICVGDNGNPFPPDFVPGFGLKSVYDKLDILFSNEYEVELHNLPEKEVCIRIPKKTIDEKGDVHA